MKKERDITKRQKEILKFISDYIGKMGIPPSIREICRNFGFKSPRSAHKHILSLEKKGYIERYSVSRGLKLTEKAERLLFKNTRIPVVGTIAAGQAIQAVENVEEEIPIISDFFNPNYEYFALKVKGDSMIKINVISGDYVIIRKQNWAENGDIVVALIDDEYATLKRFKKIDEEILLIPENDTMEIMRFHPSRVKIQGKMVGVIRILE